MEKNLFFLSLRNKIILQLFFLLSVVVGVRVGGGWQVLHWKDLFDILFWYFVLICCIVIIIAVFGGEKSEEVLISLH